MTANEFNKLVAAGPCELKMNNGDVFVIEGAEFAIADVQTAAIFAKNPGGQRELQILSIRNISSARRLETAS